VRDELVGYLRDRPAQEHRRAFDLRLPAGDAEIVLPLLGLPRAAPLLRLARASSTVDDGRQDRAAILAAVAGAGVEAARTVLELCPSELVSAALGWNRAAVEKRVKHNALRGIAAFGLLPLAGGESLLDRYLALREVAKRGQKLGPNRRLSHAAAVAVAIDHLAQVAGLPDASRLEWDCEARIAAEVSADWRLGEYIVTVRLPDVDPVIVVSRAGKELKSVPQAVRGHPRYPEVREHQERLREQARRMRSGLIDRLVASGGTFEAEELARLRGLPSAAAMLPALIWQDYFGLADVLIGEVCFLAAGSAVPLADVCPVAFSEVMRDLDLVVSVAGTDPGGYTSPLRAASRAQLLAMLIDDLGLARVTVDGTSAVVRGSRATYRVHLNTGSIHVEPGGYLCVVPASFGGTAHPNLFLPFADDDRMTSVVLSKVLLLAEDEKITDRSILAQLERQR